MTEAERLLSACHRGQPGYIPGMSQSEQLPGDDERTLLGLLPADGSPARSQEIRGQLGWDAQRYSDACAGLQDGGYALTGHGGGDGICRNLTTVPPEFRPACGHPGAHVTVRQVPVTVPHAACDLTGVSVSFPGRGGATVPATGGAIGNSMGFLLEVDSRTLDVTITVTGSAGNA
jgi:hypothetical protein